MRRIEPLTALAAAATATVLIELATTSAARYGLEAALTAVALAFVWPRRERLRTRGVAALAFLLPLAILVAHLLRGVHGDVDIQEIYPTQGQSLLDGRYPHSEYPPGAVFLFALERATGDVHVANGIVMALCHAAVVAAVAALRTRESAFVAAALAVWPLDAFFWEFKFDLLATAFLVLGLLAVLRERWELGGALLAAGTLVKWTPLFACALLAIWLVAVGARRRAGRLLLSFVALLVVVVVPLVLWDRHALAAAWTRQAGRRLTPEALLYLPLDALGRASKPAAVYDPATAPHWAGAVAVGLQVVVLVGLAVLVAWRRPGLPSAVAVAALGPAVFLLLNKIFSAQYLVTIGAATALAAALVLRGTRLLTVLALLGLGSGFNLLVYPVGRFWEPASALMFASALGAVAVVAFAVLREPDDSFIRDRYPDRP
jgi:hypothetical protein